MKQKQVLAILLVAFLASVGVLAKQVFVPVESVRGKGSAVPLAGTLTPEQQTAQTLALADGRVQAYLTGGRSEVFGVRQINHSEDGLCDQVGCWQVEIYRFDTNSTVLALVSQQQVIQVLHLPKMQPGINKRLADLAVNIATSHPDVIAALGYKPDTTGITPVQASLAGSSCDLGHLCVGPTFRVNGRFLWAVVDLTEEKLAGIAWTEAGADGEFIPFTPEGCPAPGHVERDGWVLDYWTTGTDGFEVYDVFYNGTMVLKGAKLVEWHVDYNGTYGYPGFIDVTGCGGSGGGFPIYPYTETQVIDLMDGSDVIGFELVQDFRMNSWGAACNYRYEQHIQFYEDGRFRIVGGAYGRGCGPEGVYRPVTRINLAVNGDEDDTFGYFEADQWQIPLTETYRTVEETAGHGPHHFTSEGYAAWVMDDAGMGFYVEPGQGQFSDGGRGDEPFFYFTTRQANEGGSGDLPAFPSYYCCYDDYQQGPEQFLNGEIITSTNVVLWYVAQHVTDAVEDDDPRYCWTVVGEPNPETYPCFGGPLFVPFGFGLVDISADFLAPTQVITYPQTAVFTNTTVITGNVPVNYQWDFGIGNGATTINANYIFPAAGVYTVTLTADAMVWGNDTAVRTVQVVVPYSVSMPVILKP